MRVPFLIWRFLLGDLLRLAALSTTALVGLIAFAFAVRFLAEGRIDLGGAVRLMALAAVPMLQYALPFACGFAATLTYHRFAGDNEALACAAGGVSHRAVLAPVLGMGLALSLGLAALSHLVIPHFLRSIEEVVTRDLTRVFVRAIEQGEAVRLGPFEIHAADVARAGPDPSVGAAARLRLRGVLAAQLDDAGEVRGYIAADEVGVWLFDEEINGRPATAAQLVFQGASGEGDRELIQGGSVASQRVLIPSTFVDDPKYMTYQQLVALRDSPERLPKVEVLRRALVRRLQEDRALELLSRGIESHGAVTLERLGGERVTIVAGSVRPAAAGAWTLEPAPARGEVATAVRVERTLASGATLRLSAASALLEPDGADQQNAASDAAPTVRLVMETSSPDAFGRQRQVIGGLRLPLASANAPAQGRAGPSGSAREVLASARARLATIGGGERPALAAAARQLASRIADLQREITSKQHERAASAGACFFTMLCGAITALRRHAVLPLPVYLWSFFPALASVITISAGQGLTHKSGTPGLLLLWGAVAGLALFVAREYARLARH